jgi:hypothetical protein
LATGEAVDVIGRQLVQLFHLANTGGFLLLPLECGKWDTGSIPTKPRNFNPPLETGKSNNYNRKTWKQIPTGWRMRGRYREQKVENRRWKTDSY